MQTTEEFKARIRQLEDEVSEWHHKFDAIMIERNKFAAKVQELESELDRANAIIAATPKQDHETEIDTLASGNKKLKNALEICSSELEELRKHEVEWDLAKAKVKELEKELEQYKGASHGN